MSSPGMDTKKDTKGEGMSTTHWMTTFSDLITLLLTFFVLIFTMSSMDDQKLKIAFHNFGGSSGILSFKEYREIARPMDIMINGIRKSLGERVIVSDQPETEEALADIRDLGDLGNNLWMRPVSDGIKLSFGDSLLFPPGGTEIREEMKPVLEKIARFISITAYKVYIDGHTDNTPLRDAYYGSNEELAIARAFSVRDQLAEFHEIDPKSIALTGYGGIKPVASNDSSSGRMRNRRVDIILKNQTYF
jgi:chemotaxis protein MotB